MTAKAVLLTSEDPEAFHKLAGAYYVKFQPADDVECDLVDEMVIAKWRQRRDWSNEAALFDLEMDHTKKVYSEYNKIDHACRYALATLLQLRAELKPNPGPDEPPQTPQERTPCHAARRTLHSARCTLHARAPSQLPA